MKTPAQMYAIRTLVGLFETGHYSAIVYLCGGWYQKGELARRLAIVNCATAIGPMFSSYLQAAAYTGLNGVHGMAGWQWLFIIDGVISIGIIIPQCIFFPDVPARQKPDLVFTEAVQNSPHMNFAADGDRKSNLLVIETREREGSGKANSRGNKSNAGCLLSTSGSFG